ncbi:ADP-ribosylglycohydrolase family protein [Paenibacillus glycanilyticus]|uniref:ADP-ribosylglycohydrolase family protein n=1 Tax=Paenibacillus glycanilyticus TaxID=126569 RepID=UPI00203AC948|nr:ADP-ribosylglycohydrolase family protein [Paenibacillus glycanilyticus]MCM3631157.1 ADP-ribosylglycohydrolase family protein [Paenibacillus glycanilyticus]
MRNRILGGLFGVAVGDALGGTTEFMSEAEIRLEYGWLEEIIGGGVWELEAGEITDDTAMTIAVARGILQNPGDPIEAIGEHFLRWRATNPKDIGNIIRTVFDLYDGSWSKAARLAGVLLGGKTAGNGTLMRCLPIALAYKEAAIMEEVTKRQSEMTHEDPLATEACLIYNRIAKRLLQGDQLTPAIRAEISGTRYEELLLNGGAPASLPDGFVVHTMQWVIHHLLTAESFAEVVQRAANGGGDSDTIGAIAGGLAGLYWGYDGILPKYSDKILLRQELMELGDALLAVRERGH